MTNSEFQENVSDLETPTRPKPILEKVLDQRCAFRFGSSRRVQIAILGKTDIELVHGAWGPSSHTVPN